MKCANCKWWKGRQVYLGGVPTDGWCHFDAPKACPIEVHPTPKGGYPRTSPSVVMRWPATSADDFCSGFEVREVQS